MSKKKKKRFREAETEKKKEGKVKEENLLSRWELLFRHRREKMT